MTSRMDNFLWMCFDPKTLPIVFLLKICGVNHDSKNCAVHVTFLHNVEVKKLDDKLSTKKLDIFYWYLLTGSGKIGGITVHRGYRK